MKITKMKISHRLIGAVAAVLVLVSMLSTAAFASEIQPRIATCPAGCTTGYTYYEDGETVTTPTYVVCYQHGVSCRQVVEYRYLVCSNCHERQRLVYRSWYDCPIGGIHP